MEVFPLEIQLFIAKKIASSSMRGLLAFRASTTFHWQLSEDVEVLRAVSDDCVQLFALPSPNAGKKRFMQQLTMSGHALYYVVRTAQLLHCSHPNLPMIHLVLRNDSSARSDEAIYFSIMLKVLGSGGFDKENIMSDFEGLFIRQRLAHCRGNISAGDFLPGLE